MRSAIRGLTALKHLARALTLVWFAGIEIASADVGFSGTSETLPQGQGRAGDDTVTYQFDLEPAPLAQALSKFTEITGWTVVNDRELPAAFRTPALTGRYTAEEAIRRLLRRSGLVARTTGPKEVTLEVFVQQLPGVKVRGQRNTSQTGTATKTDMPLIETPQSVAVVSSEQMKMRGAETIGEALRYTAGVGSEMLGSDNRLEWFSIRGFDQSSAMFRDGTRWGGPWEGGTEAYGLEWVEVLRGPSSVLFGQSPPGGLLNAITKRPPATPLWEVELQTGTYGRQQVAADLGGPVDGAGKWRVRLTALGRFGHTLVDSVPENRVFVAPAATWKPSPRTDLTLLTSYHRERTGFVLRYLPAEGVVLPNPNGQIPRERFVSEPDLDHYDRDTYTAGLVYNQLLGRWRFRQTTRYSFATIDEGQAFGVGFRPDLRTLDRVAYRGTASHFALTIDNQLSGVFERGGLRQALLLGVDIRRSVSRDTFGYGPAMAIDVYEPDYQSGPDVDPSMTTRLTDAHWGVYAQDHVWIREKLIFLLGGRFDWFTSNYQDLGAGTESKLDDDAASGRLGVVYLLSNGIAPYANYSTSFNPIAGVNAEGERYESETGQQLEVGFKVEPKNGSAFMTVSAYHITRQNVLTQDPDNPFNYLQRGEHRSQGIELEGTVVPARGLSLLGAVSYTDVEITETTGPELGMVPAATPDFQVSSWVNYAVGPGPLLGLVLGGGVRHRGRMFGDLMNTFTVPAVTLFDAVVQYRFRRSALVLQAKNIFDKAYGSCLSFTACNWGDGRNITAGLRTTF